MCDRTWNLLQGVLDYGGPSDEFDPYQMIRDIKAELSLERSHRERLEEVYRTAMNYRLTREENRRDWKEHLERFDACVNSYKEALGHAGTSQKGE